MYPLIALRLVKARHAEMERNASRERLARSAMRTHRASAIQGPSRLPAAPPAPATSAVPWRAI